VDVLAGGAEQATTLGRGASTGALPGRPGKPVIRAGSSNEAHPEAALRGALGGLVELCVELMLVGQSSVLAQTTGCSVTKTHTEYKAKATPEAKEDQVKGLVMNVNRGAAKKMR
jgi:hypothetical protein